MRSIARGHAVARGADSWPRSRTYPGVIGMERGNSLAGAAGENRLIAAYREIDQA